MVLRFWHLCLFFALYLSVLARKSRACESVWNLKTKDDFDEEDMIKLILTQAHNKNLCGDYVTIKGRSWKDLGYKDLYILYGLTIDDVKVSIPEIIVEDDDTTRLSPRIFLPFNNLKTLTFEKLEDLQDLSVNLSHMSLDTLTVKKSLRKLSNKTFGSVTANVLRIQECDLTRIHPDTFNPDKQGMTINTFEMEKGSLATLETGTFLNSCKTDSCFYTFLKTKTRTVERDVFQKTHDITLTFKPEDNSKTVHCCSSPGLFPFYWNPESEVDYYCDQATFGPIKSIKESPFQAASCPCNGQCLNVCSTPTPNEILNQIGYAKDCHPVFQLIGKEEVVGGVTNEEYKAIAHASIVASTDASSRRRNTPVVGCHLNKLANGEYQCIDSCEITEYIKTNEISFRFNDQAYTYSFFTCAACPEHHKCNGEEKVHCAEGTYENENNCDACLKGYQCPSGILRDCLHTNRAYSDVSGLTTCKNIDETTYCIEKIQGTDICTGVKRCGETCLDGTYGQCTSDTQTCEVCPAMSYCKNGFITACPERTYSNSNASQCEPVGVGCLVGFANICQTCDPSIPNLEPDVNNSNGCRCKEGYYNSAETGISCQVCEEGYVCPLGKKEPCTLASYKYQDAIGQTACKAIEDDFYCSLIEEDRCLTVNECSDCEDGYFGTCSIGADTNCLACDTNHKCVNGTKTPCLEGTYSLEGWSTCEDLGVACLKGNDKSCLACSVGIQDPQSNGCICESYEYNTSLDPTELSCATCETIKPFCAESSIMCDGNTEFRTCTSCQPSSVFSEGQCQDCNQFDCLVDGTKSCTPSGFECPVGECPEGFNNGVTDNTCISCAAKANCIEGFYSTCDIDSNIFECAHEKCLDSYFNTLTNLTCGPSCAAEANCHEDSVLSCEGLTECEIEKCLSGYFNTIDNPTCRSLADEVSDSCNDIIFIQGDGKVLCAENGCKDGYRLSGDYSCQACTPISNCQDSDTTTCIGDNYVCDLCVANYILTNDQCEYCGPLTCLNGALPDVCTDDGIECQVGECPNGSYNTENDRFCASCATEANCQQENVFQCDPNTNNFTCNVGSCNQGYFNTNDDLTCRAISSLNDTQGCINSEIISIEADGDIICNECLPDYETYTYYTCREKNYCNSAPCFDEGDYQAICTGYNATSGTCACTDEYSWNGTTCQRTCDTNEICQECNSGSCTSCKEGYFNVTSNCAEVCDIDFCKEDKVVCQNDTRICLACDINYHLNNEGLCIECPLLPNCATSTCGHTNETNAVNFTCLACQEGHYKNGTECSPCHESCANCYGPSETECYRCPGCSGEDENCVKKKLKMVNANDGQGQCVENCDNLTHAYVDFCYGVLESIDGGEAATSPQSGSSLFLYIGIAGGVVLLALIAIACIFFVFRKKNKKNRHGLNGTAMDFVMDDIVSINRDVVKDYASPDKLREEAAAIVVSSDDEFAATAEVTGEYAVMGATAKTIEHSEYQEGEYREPESAENEPTLYERLGLDQGGLVRHCSFPEHKGFAGNQSSNENLLRGEKMSIASEYATINRAGSIKSSASEYATITRVPSVKSTTLSEYHTIGAASASTDYHTTGSLSAADSEYELPQNTMSQPGSPRSPGALASPSIVPEYSTMKQIFPAETNEASEPVYSVMNRND